MTTTALARMQTHTPRLVPLAAVGTVTWAVVMPLFMTLSTPSLHQRPIFAAIIAGAAALTVLLYGNARGTPHLLPVVMAVLGIGVAARFLVVAASWNAEALAVPVGGTLLAMYAWAGWQSAFPPEAPVTLETRWELAWASARQAQEMLGTEVRASGELPTSGDLVLASRKLVDTIGKAARTWSRLEAGAPDGLLENIQQQLNDTRTRATAATDDITRTEWERTAEALSGQLEAVRRIRRNADRALARVQSQITQMETARLSLMAFASQDAALRAEEAHRLAQQFEYASLELDTTAGALEEAQPRASLTA